jgi:hypothetical protein
MKLTTLISLLFIFTFHQSIFSQEFNKEDLIQTWRACGDYQWDEEADTLHFQRATPSCRDNNCAEHNWSFRESGVVEFVYTQGCESGFNSKSKSPKKWMFRPNENRIKLITNDGWIEYFDILNLTDEKLVLIHRKDLEAN